MRRRAIALSGTSGSGKTILAEKLIRRLVSAGLRVAYLKHDAHRFRMDRRGKDTWRADRAGAAIVSIASPDSWAWLERSSPPAVESLVRAALRRADVCIVEGYHGSRLPKVLVVRRGLRVRRVSPAATLLATYGDVPPPGTVPSPPPPHFGWDDVDGLAERTFPGRPATPRGAPRPGPSGAPARPASRAASPRSPRARRRRRRPA